MSLADLQQRYSFPEHRPDKVPFYWCLESGGKQLVKDVIRERGIKLMVEVGVFFGGSALQWLETSPDLTVIGVDFWVTNWAPYLRVTGDSYAGGKHLKHEGISREALVSQLEGSGSTYECVLSNLWDYMDRFVPMCAASPAALYEIAGFDVTPELVYIDSDKHGDDLEACHELWPDCVICGDDWTWKPAEGYPVRKAVTAFAEKHGFEIKSMYGTWLLEKKNV